MHVAAKRSVPTTIDRYELYEKAVQTPAADIAFFVKTFRKLRGREPRFLREDFCGTACLAAEWVRGDAERTAVAIDCCAEPLAWGERHGLRHAAPDVRRRIELVHANVLDVTEPVVDLCCAMNFSFCVLKKRRDLVRYFRAVRDALEPGGVFFTELYGGTEAIVATRETRREESFTYEWEQETYNPITNETRCHIGFGLPNGARLERAFTYDWRLWTIPEVREALAEAGFSWTGVYWQEVDAHGDGTGKYHRTTEEENQETWIVFIVGAA